MAGSRSRRADLSQCGRQPTQNSRGSGCSGPGSRCFMQILCSRSGLGSPGWRRIQWAEESLWWLKTRWKKERNAGEAWLSLETARERHFTRRHSTFLLPWGRTTLDFPWVLYLRAFAEGMLRAVAAWTWLKYGARCPGGRGTCGASPRLRTSSLEREVTQSLWDPRQDRAPDLHYPAGPHYEHHWKRKGKFKQRISENKLAKRSH